MVIELEEQRTRELCSRARPAGRSWPGRWAHPPGDRWYDLIAFIEKLYETFGMSIPSFPSETWRGTQGFRRPATVHDRPRSPAARGLFMGSVVRQRRDGDPGDAGSRRGLKLAGAGGPRARLPEPAAVFGPEIAPHLSRRSAAWQPNFDIVAYLCGPTLRQGLWAAGRACWPARDPSDVRLASQRLSGGGER